jgi:hypothetical protein
MAVEFEAVREKLDGLDDEQKKLYVEKDGKYSLDTAAAFYPSTHAPTCRALSSIASPIFLAFA